MRAIYNRWSAALAFLLIAALCVVPAAVQARADPPQPVNEEYVVVYAAGADLNAVHQALSAAGAEIVHENPDVGVATVRTSNPAFLSAVAQQPLLVGAVRNRPISQIEPGRIIRDPEVEQILRGTGGVAAAGAESSDHRRRPGDDPLAPLQWDMQMIHASAQGSYAVQAGDRRVLVGIIDTGIDGSHPDLKPNFNKALSRNFVTDIPEIDGPCEYAGCVDPVDVDDGGHGTHVAGTVGAALNGLGIAGIAPRVTLVNIRAGQDSGFFFLQPVVDALVYAGKIGVDVVNMSFYTDPWLYNCPNNPADSPEAQREQRTIIAATQRAVDFARSRGVTLVAAEGNEHIDLGNPTFDDTSPDYPIDTAYPRTVDNSCVDMPTEAEGVIVVSAIGPSKTKADYSNYGVEQTNVAAPGGYFRDLLGTPDYRQLSNLVLSTYPKSVLVAEGLIDANGAPLDPSVVQDCQKGVCGYYTYLQGTSMASPHAVGVVALIVSQYGDKEGKNRDGLTMSPKKTQKVLERTATDTPCPDPRLMTYTDVGRPDSFNAYCEGTPQFNGFYGQGIVDALNAVTKRNEHDDDVSDSAAGAADSAGSANTLYLPFVRQ